MDQPSGWAWFPSVSGRALFSPSDWLVSRPDLAHAGSRRLHPCQMSTLLRRDALYCLPGLGSHSSGAAMLPAVRRSWRCAASATPGVILAPGSIVQAKAIPVQAVAPPAPRGRRKTGESGGEHAALTGVGPSLLAAASAHPAAGVPSLPLWSRPGRGTKRAGGCSVPGEGRLRASGSTETTSLTAHLLLLSRA